RELTGQVGHVLKGGKHHLGERLHGLIERLIVLRLVGEKPVAIVVQPNTPEEVHRLRGKALKRIHTAHRCARASAYSRGKSALRASSAAACSAFFLLLPAPVPTTTPLRSTCTRKRLS